MKLSVLQRNLVSIEICNNIYLIIWRKQRKEKKRTTQATVNPAGVRMTDFPARWRPLTCREKGKLRILQIIPSLGV